MYKSNRKQKRNDIAVVIPALDEEKCVGVVVRDMKEELFRLGYVPVVVVADNGSKDDTQQCAWRAGAEVVLAPKRGYGYACLEALRHLRLAHPDVNVVIFADGDTADDPADLQNLLAPIEGDWADLVIGSRDLGAQRGWAEKGSLSVVQQFGNRLATGLLRWGFGVTTTDLGPFRAIRMKSLALLEMDDQDFGWTVQMQARAAKMKLRSCDVAVHYRRRAAGKSKVSGNIKGSILAGTIILRTTWQEARRKS
ncbi:MAG: glycosyltransferase family 2 protein [Deltaproteobacteria bacterium]|nr:glycosyltransferase family 2 protein [Deltaproteobacteria bacterium]